MLRGISRLPAVRRGGGLLCARPAWWRLSCGYSDGGGGVMNSFGGSVVARRQFASQFFRTLSNRSSLPNRLTQPATFEEAFDNAVRTRTLYYKNLARRRGREVMDVDALCDLVRSGVGQGRGVKPKSNSLQSLLKRGQEEPDHGSRAVVTRSFVDKLMSFDSNVSGRMYETRKTPEELSVQLKQILDSSQPVQYSRDVLRERLERQRSKRLLKQRYEQMNKRVSEDESSTRQFRRVMPKERRVDPRDASLNSDGTRKKLEVFPGETVRALARRMHIKIPEVTARLGHIESDKEWLPLSRMTAEESALVMESWGFVPEDPSERRGIVNRERLARTRQEGEPRAPVVCIMGHVDHGKTSLLDRLRSTRRVDGEAGGITQNIGAFVADLRTDTTSGSYLGDADAMLPSSPPPQGSAEAKQQQQQEEEDEEGALSAFQQAPAEDTFRVTFLDTPGHAAFSRMRARGASSNCADIVILVVSAVDGVKPQTVEALTLALDAKSTVIVCFNKIDLPGADVSAAMTQLKVHGMVVEELGGDVLSCNVSCKTGEGFDELVSTLRMCAELAELRADPAAQSESYVVESMVTRAGPVVNVIVKQGTLRVGDALVCGMEWGTVRSMTDDQGRPVTEAGPSMAVSVLGFRGVERLDDLCAGTEDENKARSVVEGRRRAKEMTQAARGILEDSLDEKMKAEQEESRREGEKDDLAFAEEMGYDPALLSRTSFNSLYRTSKGADRHRLLRQFRVVQVQLQQHRAARRGNLADKKKNEHIVPVVVKTDVGGSLDVLAEYFALLPHQEFAEFSIVRSGLGPILESDVQFAKDHKCLIYGFNVQPRDQAVVDLAFRYQIPICAESVMYSIFDEVKGRLKTMLPPVVSDEVVGRAEVKALFDVTGKDKRTKVKSAGVEVVWRTISKDQQVRVMRDVHDDGKPQEIWRGEIFSLRHFKDSVTELKSGTEGGVVLDGFDSFIVGDTLENLTVIQELREVDDSMARGYRGDQFDYDEQEAF